MTKLYLHQTAGTVTEWRAGATFNRGALVIATIAALLGVPAQAASTLEQQVERLGKEVDELKQKAETARPDSGGSRKTTIGGYGELHYNHLDSKNEIDFHRFVLFFGHNFTDRIRFYSEFELEHAFVRDTPSGTPRGEVELEQAFLDFDLTGNHTARGGLFLIPVGILNEFHEPPTFYGVERNPVETNIVPSTWWEGGAAVYGDLMPGLRYDFAVTSGLAVATSGANAFLIRNGRQKVSNAVANDPAYTARLKWTGMPGVELATTLQYQQDVTQSALADSVSALLTEAHAVFTRGPFGLRALYAQWNLDGAAPEAVGRDKQRGWYVEPSFKITPKFGVFARYNEWDNQAGNATDSKKKQTDVGFNYWPHEQVVIKVDMQNQSGTVNDDGFNVGIGYMF